MSDYTLPEAFEDVSRAVLAAGEPLDYDRRFEAAKVLHALVRAGYAAGFPVELDGWPIHPAEVVAAAARRAGAPRPFDHAEPGNSSAWALLETAAELRIGAMAQQSAGVSADDLEDEFRFADELIDAAEHFVDNVGGDLPGADELDEYDADLQRSRYPAAALGAIECQDPDCDIDHG